MPHIRSKNVKFLAPNQDPTDEEDEDEVLLVPNQADNKDGQPKRRKSFSTMETIETFDKENNPAVRLEEQIKLRHLQELQNEFDQHRPADIRIPMGACRPDKVEKRVAGAMNLREFQDAVAKVLGTREYSEYLEKLFTKLDTSCDGYVDWEEFLTYFMLLYRENDYLRSKKDIPFQVEAVIRHIVQNRQEPTTKIVAVDSPTRYLTISKEGAMAVWHPNMTFEKSYTVATDEGETPNHRRRFKMWVTDAVYMKNCQKVAVGSTGRDIRFYDVSTNQYFEEFHLCSMADVPYCFDYWYNEKAPNTESLLIFGVDTGAIHLLYFQKPVTQLFETPFKSEGGAQKVYMQDLQRQSKYVKHVLLEKIHPDLIRQVRYMPENDAIISSSASPVKSIVISDTQPDSFSVSRKRSYVFKIEKGVECFDYSRILSILVTGSADHHVRLWNPYVPNKPVAVLVGHATGVIGVAIHEGFLQVFSYSKDAVIKVWDIKEHSLLQNVILQFPSSLHARMPDHGPFPLHLQPSPHDALIVTCNDYIGMLKLGRVEPPADKNMALTHDTQLCCAIYNNFFKQVVTGCDSSSIAVWDIETGNKAIVFSNAHGDEEITSLVFDDVERRLLSGARNGTIKVWNFQNGHNLHKLEPAHGEAEVTGILPLADKKVIVAVGWSRLITTYNDSDGDDQYVPADYSWKGGQLHHDDILTCDYCPGPPQYIATGGFDGEIIVWDVETEAVFVRLRKGQPTDMRLRLEELQGQSADIRESLPQSNGDTRLNSRPNSRHRASHKVPSGHPVPVDKLLFLRARASVKHTEKAMLLSSEAGIIRWWNVFSTRPEMGYFYAPDAPDESVLAMCSKRNNSLLVTGDTQGIIKLWNIMDYCIIPQDRRVKTSPPLECSWKAHDAPVVSVDYVSVESVGDFILSASTDKTARLWTLEGHFVGTFGQSRPWNLKIRHTWMHPKTPWTNEGDDTKGNVKVPPSAVSQPATEDPFSHASTPAAAQVTPVAQENSARETGRNDTQRSQSSMTKISAEDSHNGDTEWEEEDINIDGTDSESLDGSSAETRKVKLRPMSIAVVEKKTSLQLQRADLGLKYRSQTFAFDYDRSKTFLGIKVEHELERQQRDRKGRRQVYGEIEVRHTQRFGKLCSPYQALATPIFEDIQLPKNIPLTQRMINKGYTSDNLTVDMIRTMDFSYGGSLDTPPSSQQTMSPTPAAKKQSVGERPGSKLPPIKSRRSSRSSTQGSPLPFKKIPSVSISDSHW